MGKHMIGGIVISISLAFLLTWLFWPSDEEQIVALFDELCEVASKTEDASTLSDAMVVKDFKELFAPKVVISIRSKARIAGEHTNQGLAQLYGRLRVASRRMELRCEQLQSISIGNGVAVYSVKFYAGWTGKGGNVVRENAHSRVELSKHDGDWKISQIDYLKK
ncbi:MAG: hypothetical protein QNL65_06385 [Opitutales bacterium]|jgi:hypothetical protein